MSSNSVKSKIHIICPVYNGDKYLNNLVQSIRKQERVSDFSVQYILSESTDKSEEVLKEMEADYVKITASEFNHARTREKYALLSNSDILVFITQDVRIVDNQWLYYLVKDIEKDICSAAFSRQICDDVNSLEYEIRNTNYPNKSYINDLNSIESKGLNAFFYSDASSAIDTKVFKKLKGYDNKELPTNEDMYIAHKLITNGYKIKYCSKSKVIHYHNFSYKELYKRYYDAGLFFSQEKQFSKYSSESSGFNLAKKTILNAIMSGRGIMALKYIPNYIIRYYGMKSGQQKGKKL